MVARSKSRVRKTLAAHLPSGCRGSGSRRIYPLCVPRAVLPATRLTSTESSVTSVQAGRVSFQDAMVRRGSLQRPETLGRGTIPDTLGVGTGYRCRITLKSENNVVLRGVALNRGDFPLQMRLRYRTQIRLPG